MEESPPPSPPLSSPPLSPPQRSPTSGVASAGYGEGGAGPRSGRPLPAPPARGGGDRRSKSVILIQSMFRRMLSIRLGATLRKRVKHRQFIIREIVQTEVAYIENLDQVIDEFLVPLREQETLISSENLRLVFSNIELLANLNKTLLKRLEERVEQWEAHTPLSDVFAEMGPFLKMYSQYCGNYSVAIETLVQVRESTPAFVQFEVAKQEILPHPKLESYLIMPIQRIPRYNLLLEDLVMHTWPEHPDYDALCQALSTMKQVADHVNGSMHSSEKMNKVYQIVCELGGECEDLVKPHRHFVSMVEMQRLMVRASTVNSFLPLTRAVRMYMFNDMLLFSQKLLSSFRYSANFPLLETWAIPLPPIGRHEHVFEIFSPTRVTFTLAAESEEEKEDWIGRINQQIEQLLKDKKSSGYADHRAQLVEKFNIGGFARQEVQKPSLALMSSLHDVDRLVPPSQRDQLCEMGLADPAPPPVEAQPLSRRPSTFQVESFKRSDFEKRGGDAIDTEAASSAGALHTVDGSDVHKRLTMELSKHLSMRVEADATAEDPGGSKRRFTSAATAPSDRRSAVPKQKGRRNELDVKLPGAGGASPLVKKAAEEAAQRGRRGGDGQVDAKPPPLPSAAPNRISVALTKVDGLGENGMGQSEWVLMTQKQANEKTEREKEKEKERKRETERPSKRKEASDKKGNGREATADVTNGKESPMATKAEAKSSGGKKTRGQGRDQPVAGKAELEKALKARMENQAANAAVVVSPSSAKKPPPAKPSRPIPSAPASEGASGAKASSASTAPPAATEKSPLKLPALPQSSYSAAGDGSGSEESDDDVTSPRMSHYGQQQMTAEHCCVVM